MNIIRKMRPDLFDHQILVCSKNPKKNSCLSVESVKSFGNLLSLPIAPGYFLRLWLLTRKSDLLLLHAPFPLADLLLALLPMKQAKLIVYWHSDIIRQKISRILIRPFICKTLQKAAVIIVSDMSLVQASSLLGPYRKKCFAFPFPVDAGRFHELALDPSRIEALRQRNPNLVVACGRLVSYKGFDILVEASKSVEGKIIIIGDGPERARLQRQIEASGLTKKVILVGSVSDDDLPYYLAAAKLFVLPSVSEAETFGIIQLEAMAAGTPIVNTRLNTAVPLLARHEIEGLTVTPRDAASLAQAVNRILGDDELRMRLAHNARSRAYDFSIRSYSDFLTQKFIAVLTESRSASMT